jgi:putative Ca2+/H+ antiporter (TMEM165/GDT1 family)
MLAARFKKPLPIIAGIFAATAVNHGLAGALGAWITRLASPDVLRWVLGVSFLAMAAWTLRPDRIEEDESQIARRLGVFGATLVTFFLAEMGDKTQLATVALAAQYHAVLSVMCGSTLGLLAANVPVVYAGKAFAGRLPLRGLRIAAALVFIALGLWVLVSA